MTILAFDFNFFRDRATATDTSENRKPIQYLSTLASYVANQYIENSAKSRKDSPLSTTATEDISSGIVFSVQPRFGTRTIESNAFNAASRKNEKLLLERQIVQFLEFTDFEDDSAESIVDAVPEALVFINELPEDLPLPSASLDLDGIVTLEWQDNQKKAAAMFEGGSDYGYAFYDNGKYVAGAYKASVGNGIPRDLTSYLTA